MNNRKQLTNIELPHSSTTMANIPLVTLLGNDGNFLSNENNKAPFSTLQQDNIMPTRMTIHNSTGPQNGNLMVLKQEPFSLGSAVNPNLHLGNSTHSTLQEMNQHLGIGYGQPPSQPYGLQANSSDNRNNQHYGQFISDLFSTSTSNFQNNHSSSPSSMNDSMPHTSMQNLSNNQSAHESKKKQGSNSSCSPQSLSLPEIPINPQEVVDSILTPPKCFRMKKMVNNTNFRENYFELSLKTTSKRSGTKRSLPEKSKKKKIEPPTSTFVTPPQSQQLSCTPPLQSPLQITSLSIQPPVLNIESSPTNIQHLLSNNPTDSNMFIPKLTPTLNNEGKDHSLTKDAWNGLLPFKPVVLEEDIMSNTRTNE